MSLPIHSDDDRGTIEHKNNIVYLLQSDSTITNVDNYFQSILDAHDECYDNTTVATRSSDDGVDHAAVLPKREKGVRIHTNKSRTRSR